MENVILCYVIYKRKALLKNVPAYNMGRWAWGNDKTEQKLLRLLNWPWLKELKIVRQTGPAANYLHGLRSWLSEYNSQVGIVDLSIHTPG